MRIRLIQLKVLIKEALQRPMPEQGDVVRIRRARGGATRNYRLPKGALGEVMFVGTHRPDEFMVAPYVKKNDVGIGYYCTPDDVEIVDRSESFGQVISAASKTFHGVRTPEGNVGYDNDRVDSYLMAIFDGKITRR